jgi:hypothetical protein
LASSRHRIAQSDNLEIGKINDTVATGVRSSKMFDLDSYSAEPDGVLLIVCDAGHGRMCIEIGGLVRFEVLREIRVPDNLSAGCEILRVIARVIRMVVRDDEELTG